MTVPAGRRSGKTEALMRHCAECAIGHVSNDTDGRYILAAPTHRQAKDIFWQPMKKFIPAGLIQGKPSETDLVIRLKNGIDICVMGMEAPERAEGRPILGIGLDEYGNMKPEVWTEHIQPALNDPQEINLGWAWFIGVPEGRNHYYELVQRAIMDKTGAWDYHTWPSSEILPPAVIEQAKHDLDPLTFAQEYMASFVTFEGQAYYPFNRWDHARWKLPYNPRNPLLFLFDFNVAPGVAVVAQEWTSKAGLQQTHLIGEVHIPQNSTTPMVCRKLIQEWKGHQGDVIMFGDATGGNRGTAKVAGSDWDLIKNELRPVFGSRLRWRVPNSNPLERSRVNSVNCRLKSVDGTVRMLVDPVKCPNTIKDFEGVRLVKGSAGEIDKKTDESLTHLTDAIGYYIHRIFPLGATVYTKSEAA